MKPSSDIASISYHEPSQHLTVIFLRGGRMYAYEGIPRDVYAAFITAPSAGKFFHEQIKPNYKGTPIDNAKA